MTIDILISPDLSYVGHTGIMLCSLFTCNKSHKFRVHVFFFENGLNKDSQKKLETVTESFGNEIFYYNLPADLLKQLPIGHSWQSSLTSKSTYLRLWSVRYLPVTINRILYLDGDIIVNGPIDELVNITLEEYAVAACPGSIMYDPVKHAKLRTPIVHGYFNAGVLLINLDYWRKNDLESKFLKFATENYQLLQYHDQDILNALLHDKWKRLSLKYNFTSYFLSKSVEEYDVSMQEDIISAIKQPIIIHYTGIDKPWIVGSKHPLRSRYEKYKAVSPWKDIPLEDSSRAKKKSQLQILKYRFHGITAALRKKHNFEVHYLEKYTQILDSENKSEKL